MKNIFIFLVILFLILTLILIGVSFYFSGDSLVKFVPEKTNFYLHFNFNQGYWQGFKATNYFIQHWPDSLLERLLFDRFSAFKYNLTPGTLEQIDEMAVFYFENQPVIIYKYKPIFANFSLILGGPNRPRIFYRFFDSQTVALTTKQGLLEKISAKPTKISFKNFDLNEFMRGFVNGWQIRARINQNKIVLQLQSLQIFPKENFEQELELLFKNFSSLKQGSFLIAFNNQSNFSIQQIEGIFRKKMAYFFPEERERILPDGSKIKELIAEPKVFEFERKSSPFNFDILKVNLSGLDFVLTANQKYIFLSNKEEFLNRYLANQESGGNECLKQEAEEIFYWQSKEIGIKNLIFSGREVNKGSLIVGCLEFE
ncbi:MAG: hypothetical protein ACP5IX_00665 [Patescibacteria group bacterium]